MTSGRAFVNARRCIGEARASLHLAKECASMGWAGMSSAWLVEVVTDLVMADMWRAKAREIRRFELSLERPTTLVRFVGGAS